MESHLERLCSFLRSTKTTKDSVCCECKETFLTEKEGEWICDSCMDQICSERSSSYLTVDEMLEKLPEGIRFAHVNLRSIYNKLDEIRILLRNGTFDIFAVTETHLDASIPDSKIAINGYTVIRKDRDRNGGGVLMYIKYKWTVENIVKDDLLEFLSLEVKLPNSQKIYVGVVYRPPTETSKWKDQFEERIKNQLTPNIDRVIMGDFNIDQRMTTDFEDLMKKCGFSQIISQSTRETRDTGTLIDHIYVQSEVLESGVIPIGMSDHHLVYFIRKEFESEPHPEHTFVMFRDVEKLNRKDFVNDLNAVDWSPVKSYANINVMWTSFITMYMEVVDNHLPVKEQSDAPKWINEDIISEIQKKDILHQKALKSSDEVKWTQFKAAKNRVKAKIISEKLKFTENVLDKTEPKHIWREIKQSFPEKPELIRTTHMVIDERIVSDSKDIANAFNESFCETGRKLAEKSDNPLPEFKHLMPEGSFSITPNITIDFVKKEIFALSNTWYTGLDNISLELLKISLKANYFAEIITFLLNKSLENGEVASEWKKAGVSPHFKKDGDNHNKINNYRPACSLPVFSKVLEKHVFNLFYKYLDHNNLLNIHQPGLRPKHSCETALIRLSNNWLSNLDKMKSTGSLFIDLRKAFDGVNHNLLLCKLRSFGICHDSCTGKWFKSFITGRTQFVRWKRVYSDEKIVTVGVPRRSILGTLFFILYFNDYPTCLEHSNVTMYANKICLYASHQSIRDIKQKLSEDLSNTMKWMKNNKITINLKETQCMLTSSMYDRSDSKEMHIQINDIALTTVKSTKFLGVEIDNCLTWAGHLKVLNRKLTKEKKKFKYLQNVLSKEALMKIYDVVIFPQLKYCCSVWCSARKTSLVKNLDEIQKGAASVILRKKSAQITNDDLCNLKWMSYHDYFEYRKLFQLFNILKQESLKDEFDYQKDSSNDTLLDVPQIRLKYYGKSFKISSAILWNELPEPVKACGSLPEFKNALKEHFMSKYNLD